MGVRVGPPLRRWGDTAFVVVLSAWLIGDSGDFSFNKYLFFNKSQCTFLKEVTLYWISIITEIYKRNIWMLFGPNSTDVDNLSPTTSQESNRSRQPKNKSSRCLNSRDDVEMDSTDTSAECNRVLHQPESPELGPNFGDADNLAPQRVEQIQAIKKQI
jgi:hypothetical protein